MGKKELKYGERGLNLILIVFSVFAIYESLKISGKKLTSTSPGAFPLFISIMLFLFAVWIWMEKIKVHLPKKSRFGVKLKEIISLIFTKDILVIIFLLVIYSIALQIIGFTLATFLFLWISMSYLGSGKILRSLSFSVLSVAIILFIFKTIFKVILP